MTKRNKIIIGSILVLILPVAIYYIAQITKQITGLSPEDIQNFAHDNVFLELSIIIVIYIIKSVLFFIPIVFIYVLTGALFPPHLAIIFNIIGMAVSLSITFLIGKLLGDKYVHKLAGKSKKMAKFMDNPKKNNLTLFILRISGLFPVELLSLVCGSTGYKYWFFLFTSIIAMLPGMIPFSIMGTAIIKPFSKEFLVPLAIAILVTAGSMIFYKIKNKEIVG